MAWLLPSSSSSKSGSEAPSRWRAQAEGAPLESDSADLSRDPLPTAIPKVFGGLRCQLHGDSRHRTPPALSMQQPCQAAASSRSLAAMIKAALRWFGSIDQR